MSTTESQSTKPLITDDELRALYRAGKKIDALRELRARDGSSLAEAKGYLDSIMTADDFAAWEAMQAARLAPTEPVGLKLEWGMPQSLIPAGVQLAWGARAIYSLHSYETKRDRRGKVIQRASTEAIIDLLPDRQSVSDIRPAPLIDERRAFGDWINKTAIPALKKWCVKQYVTSDSEDKFELTEGRYMLIASPRGSCGYLYITAWLAPASEDK